MRGVLVTYICNIFCERESDASAHFFAMSGWQSPWPLPSVGNSKESVVCVFGFSVDEVRAPRRQKKAGDTKM